MTKKPKEHRDYLTDNIEALEVAYDQMISILKEDIDLDSIGDDKWKHIADGKLKAQESVDGLFKALISKKQELDDIDNPDKTKKEEKKGSNLSKHLQ